MDTKWKLRFIDLALHIATWSKEDVKVGAVLVNESRKVKGVGYNGAPPSYDDSKVTAENSTFIVVHAEVNALLNSTGKDLTMFVTRAPCLACAGAIAATGMVTKLICPVPSKEGRWAESMQEGINRLRERNIEVEFV